MYDSYQRNGGGSGSPTSAGEGDCGRADGADRRSHDFRHQFSVIGQVEDRYDSVEVPRWIACDRRRRLFGGTLGVLLLVAAITSFDGFDGFGQGHPTPQATVASASTIARFNPLTRCHPP